MKLFRILMTGLMAVVISLSAAAAFTPSVEYKEAPSVVGKTDDQGNTIVGEIKNDKGEVVATMPGGTITITALSEVKKEDSTVDKVVEDRLLYAEQELAYAFAEPEDSLLLDQISRELNDAPVDNIVISDVLNVSVSEEIEKQMVEGATITVAVISQNITKEDEDLIVIYQRVSEKGGWKKVDFTIDENNVITMELQGTGDIVIFRDNEAAPPKAEDAPASPATSGNVA